MFWNMCFVRKSEVVFKYDNQTYVWLSYLKTTSDFPGWHLIFSSSREKHQKWLDIGRPFFFGGSWAILQKHGISFSCYPRLGQHANEISSHCIVVSSLLQLTLSQPGGGGGHIVPPQVHFLKYLRNALSYGLETFWQFKWIKLKSKNLFFNRLRPPLVTIATFKVDACFWKAHFGSFHAKAYQNSMFFATPMKNGWTVVCCENLG